ncbi:MAG: transcriptional repressor [Lachnospiraceae bacterium]
MADIIPTIRHSKQRDAILMNLRSRMDHPTADVIYEDVRKEIPNISLGTVYRNLSLLVQLGEIQQLSIDNGSDHYDGNPAPHYHFTCSACGRVMDMDSVPFADHFSQIVNQHFAGRIDRHTALFYGLCENCYSPDKERDNHSKYL